MKCAFAGAVVLVVLAACSKDDETKPKTADDVTVAANAAPTPAPAPAPTAAPAPAPEAAPAPVVQDEAPPPAAPEEPEADPEADPRAKGKKPAKVKTAGILGSSALTQGGEFASLTGTGDISSGFDDADIQGGLYGNEEGELKAGFGYGREGFGPGGRGTGAGTVGSGQYGTIGHGSGVGSGYGTGAGRGGMRGRTSAAPQVRIGQPICTGELDKAIVRRYIKRNITKIMYCYEKQLLAKAGLEGTVNAQFVIADTGVVLDSKASGVHAEVATCVAAVIKYIEFPKPKSGVVQCTYPFNFKPTGG